MNNKKIFERDCFVHNGSYFAARISVFSDGSIECWGRMDKDKFIKSVESGFITVDIPDGESLRICDQDLVVKLEESRWNCDRPKDNIKKGDLMFKHKFIKQKEFIKEILDRVYTAKGNKSAAEICYDNYNNYIKNPTKENKEKLEESYELVPEHNRRYILGDQDLKDLPIKEILLKEEK